MCSKGFKFQYRYHWKSINAGTRAEVKYVLSNTDTNTFFSEFQIQYKYTGKNLIKYKYKYSPSNKNTNTHRGRYKIAAILQMTYSNSFYCKKIILFIQISLNCYQRSNLQWACIDLDDGLALSMQQAIIWPIMARFSDA